MTNESSGSVDWTGERYRRWAEVEARGSSPAYERLALAVADSPDTLALLQAVDPARRQPNLLFGALRWHGAPVLDPPAALDWLLAHPVEVLEVLRTRRTQTNEVARCATLLPALALLPQPLALVEVGASAGLCLLYDRWRYRFSGERIDRWIGMPTSRVTLTCRVSGRVPVPPAVPTITWRAGLDLSPVNAADAEERRWLQALVWPEHVDRSERLTAALEVAAVVNPRIDRGDLVRDLPALLEEAPPGTTLVVTHSATLAYLEPRERDAFRSIVGSAGAHRLGAEGPEVLPDLAAQLSDAMRGHSLGAVSGRFVVSLDEVVLGVAQPHGRSLHWLGLPS